MYGYHYLHGAENKKPKWRIIPKISYSYVIKTYVDEFTYYIKFICR